MSVVLVVVDVIFMDGFVYMLMDSIALVASTDVGEVAGDENHLGVILTSMDIAASAVEDSLVVVDVDGVGDVDKYIVCDDSGGRNMGKFFNLFPLGMARFYIEEV